MNSFRTLKYILLAVICFLVSSTTSWAKGNVFRTFKVDESFEYSSIIWRLAGAEEYSDCNIRQYAEDIDEYFRPYTDHPLIEYCREIRRTNDIGADAIPKAAAFMDVSSYGVRLSDGHTLEEICRADDRWTEDVLEKYIVLLDKFYKESRFHTFFEQHKGLYKTVEENTRKSLQGKIDDVWFKDFYGEGLPDNLNYYISVNNGSCNYGLIGYLPESRQGLLSSTYVRGGKPAGAGESVVVHELNHRFANPLANQYLANMQDAIDVLYPSVKELLADYCYGKESIPYEWLTSLFSLQYFDDRPASQDWVSFMVTDNMIRGIIWQRRAFDFMKRHFNHNRKEYATIHDFMPELVMFLNYTASEISNLVKEYESSRPYVYDVYPLPGAKLDLTKDRIEFEIRFSEEMLEDLGFEFLFSNPDIVTEAMLAGLPKPKAKWKDESTFSITLDTEWIKTIGFYGIKLNGPFFRNKKFWSIAESPEFTYTVE